MEAVGSRLRHQVGNWAGAAAILRRVVQTELLELFHRVFDGDVVRTAAQAFTGRAVNEKPVEIFAQSIDNGVVTIFHVRTGHVDCSGSQLDQIVNITPIKR